MEENVNLTPEGQPEPPEGNLPPESEETTPLKGNTESAFVEVKFNKEIKRLSLDEAATLAQKGMKFDLIASDLEKLKALSKGEGLSVSDYISRLEGKKRDKQLTELLDKCGGNSELAEKLLKLEAADRPDEFAALKAEFPDASYDELPDEVKTAAELKGTGLLFEYLLYEHRQRVAANEELLRREASKKLSLGSLSSGISRDAADTEFLKGVWGK